ncbi:YbaB/EbfC family nucleoid-associated protein [Mycoplasmopsis cynos]|nr:hypothetical protein [Mycoplasmopsis cynos]WAM09237.1 YbaB/EbfC family nucleoid-associated protein [Mycoplasmopsis cynos]
MQDLLVVAFNELMDKIQEISQEELTPNNMLGGFPF